MTSPPPIRRSALGRGLAALIPSQAESAGSVEIPIDRISPNPHQPRRTVDDEGLQELADSIRIHGVLQPVIVTETLDGYQLVAGERRVRAARLAGLSRIPAVVRQLAGRDQLELALVENLQRQDLNPLEEALAFRQLIEEFGYTQAELAERLGRARSSVANTLRLLDLEASVQEAVAAGRLSEGHARAIAGLDPDRQRRAAATIAQGGLSVRQAEALARRLRQDRPVRTPRRPPTGGPDDVEALEEGLRRALGTRVTLLRGRRKGRIVIEFYGEDELDRLYRLLTGESP